MLAYQIKTQDNKVTIRDSGGQGIQSNDPSEILNYLLGAPEGFNIVWNIDLFVAPILKLLGTERIRELFEVGKTYLEPYSIIYNQGKSLCVRVGGQKAIYYYIEQYYKDEPEPDLNGLITKTKYMLDELSKLGIYPKKLTSPVAMLEELFDRLNLPNYEDIPDEVNQWAWECAGKSWTEAHQLGWFPKVFDYDQNSSFPSIVAELFDTRYGTWEKDSKYQPEALYGFMDGDIEVIKPISPFVYVNSKGHQVSPKDKWPTKFLKQEYDHSQKYQNAKLTFTDGWWWFPKKRYQPLKYTMERLFGERQKIHPKVIQGILKRAMVGIWGRFLQTFRGKGGSVSFAPSFNPVWGSCGDTIARLKVAEFIYDNNLEADLVHVATDGLIATRDAGIPQSKKMGEWRLDSSGEALVVGSGMLFYADKKPLQITYPEAMAMIKADPLARTWNTTGKRMMTLGDALVFDLDIVGTEKDIFPGFSLQIDHDRFYPKLPRNGQELLDNTYQSEPLSVEVLA